MRREVSGRKLDEEKEIRRGSSKRRGKKKNRDEGTPFGEFQKRKSSFRRNRDNERA